MIAKNRSTTGTREARTATEDGLMIRRSRAEDAAAIERLAQLDSQRAPTGDLMLAEAGGELVAAVAVLGNQVIADPFRPTDHIVGLLRVSAAQRDARRTGRRSWSRVPRVPRRVSLVRS
jgi:hypothetical protein